MKKLVNHSENAFIYTQGREKFILPIGGEIEVPNEIANIWLKYVGVEEVKAEVKKETKTTKTTTKRK